MRLTVPLVAALLLLGGCSGEDAEPTAAPTTSSATTAPTSESPESLEDPVTYGSEGGRMVFRCFPNGPREMVIFDTMTVSRTVTLDGLTTGSDALRIRNSWVAPLSKQDVPEGGAIDLAARGTQVGDLETWGRKRTLAGARLEPGRYTFFTRADVLPDRSLDDLDLAWTDDTTSGTSPYDYQGRTKSGGC